MANDINKEDPHYKGEYGSIYEVNRKFPTGGVAGDFVVIEGWAHYWNAVRGTWCVNAERDSYWDELITNIIEKFKLVRGATFMGVASLDTVPTKVIGAKMYYFATVAGTYKNFDNLVVPQGINVLYSDNGSSWVNTTLLEVAQELGVSTNKVVSQKTLNDALAKKFDKESVVQESGEAEDKVMSQKAVSTKLNDLSSSKADKDSDSESLISDGSEEFVVADSTSNVIFKVDNEGTKAKSYNICDENGKVVKTITKEWLEKIESYSSQMQTEQTRVNGELDKKADKDSDSESLISDGSEEFVVADSTSNVIFKVDNEGTKAKSYNICDENGKVVKTITKEWLEKIESYSSQMQTEQTRVNGELDKKADKDSDSESLMSDASDSFKIVDNQGNVSVEIGRDGLKVSILQANKIKDATGKDVVELLGSCKKSWLYGKTFATLGDSLSTAGTWQEKLCDLTGMHFDKEMNTDREHPVSYGGTNSTDSFCNTMERARNLVEYWVNQKEKNIDVLFIENVNDTNKAYGYVMTLETSSINADSFFEAQSIILKDQVFGSKSEALEYVKSNIQTIVPEPVIGTVIYAIYKDTSKKGYKITVNSAATKSGQILLNVGGQQFGINVEAGDSENAIAKKIEEYYYPDYIDVLEDNSVIFSSINNVNVQVKIVSNSSDASLSLTNTDYVNIYDYIFNLSKDEEGFYNSANWTDNFRFLSIRSCYKGLLSYLIKNLPHTKIYWLMPTCFGVDFVNKKYVYANGEWDYSKYYKSPEPWNSENASDYNTMHSGSQGGRIRALVEIQKEVCNLFGIECIDLNQKGSINLDNAEQYYYSNNVHPKDIGYKKWGEDIFRIIS